MIDLMKLVTEARDDQQRQGAPPQEDGGTDYGAGAPEPDDPTDQAEQAPDNTPDAQMPGYDQQNDPNANQGGAGQNPAQPGQQPPGGNLPPDQQQAGPGDDQGGMEDPNAAGGEGEEGGQYNDDPNSLDNGEDSVNRSMGGEQPEDEMRRAGTTIVALLRSYISLYNIIRRTIKKIGESRKNSVLATVVFAQVKDNLYTLEDMIYKYIILEFDGAPHEINVYNYNYLLEIFNWNLEMLEKINKIQAKAMEKS